MNSTHMKMFSERYSCTGEAAEDDEHLPYEITTASIIAAIQVREAVKFINGLTKQIAGLIHYDGINCIFENVALEVNPDCQIHKMGNINGGEGRV